MYRLKIVLLTTVILLLMACNTQNEELKFQRYSANFLGTFDTVVQVIGYTRTEEEFNSHVDEIQKQFQKFHKLYDKFNDYEGINNIKTINDHAGILPVEVEQEIIDLIIFSKEWHSRTYGKMDITIGNLLEIWDESMREASHFPEFAKLPSMEELNAASRNGSIEDIIVDKEAMTVFLKDEKMRLDVGAIAKGYAAEIIGNEMLAKGFTSGAIISGGNWKILGEPRAEDRDYWVTAIQNPDKPYALDEASILTRVYTRNRAIDTSGDYQRYVMIEDIRVHHIIDKETMLPGNYHRGVTVLADDAGVADYLSTELFLLPYEQGRTLVDNLDGVDALWVMKDGTVRVTEGMLNSMKRNESNLK